jgi:hypothetical protein
MSQYVTLQPSARVDHITEDGTELTQLPYPFHVAEDGYVWRQDFWQGRVLRVIGFQTTLHEHRITVPWADAWKDPEDAVGRYLVTEDRNGTWSTHVMAIQSATKHEGNLGS